MNNKRKCKIYKLNQKLYQPKIHYQNKTLKMKLIRKTRTLKKQAKL